MFHIVFSEAANKRVMPTVSKKETFEVKYNVSLALIVNSKDS